MTPCLKHNGALVQTSGGALVEDFFSLSKCKLILSTVGAGVTQSIFLIKGKKIINWNNQFNRFFFIRLISLFIISLKKIKISSQLTIFLLFGIVIIFVSLIFFTFKALLLLSLLYLISIPASYFLYKRTKNKVSKIMKEEEHEDIL